MEHPILNTNELIADALLIASKKLREPKVENAQILNDRMDKIEKEMEQLRDYIKRFAYWNRMGLPKEEL